jgi:hypothetical protein
MSPIALLISACLAFTGSAVAAPVPTPGGSAGPAIGIRLLEAPVAERGNPRAYKYIVDHVPPGTVMHRRIEISNESAQPQSVDVSAGSATVDHGEFIWADDSTGNELTSWISFDTRALRLRPWEKRPVTVTIAVPAIATGGEHFAVIWAAVTARPPDGGITAVNRVGIRIYLDVGPGGAPRSDFAIGDFTAARGTDRVPSLSVLVRNTGGRVIDVSGTLDLTDGPAGTRAGPVKADTTATLRPGESGTVIFMLPADLPNGPWLADVNLASGAVRHAAQAPVTFPDPAGPPRVTSPFAAHRTAIIIAAGVAALAVATALLLIRRRRRQLSESSSGTASSGL